MKNFPLKILALICSILLWIFVINEGFRIDYLDTEIPIQTRNLAEDLSVVNDLGSVKIKLRAPKDFWQKKENISKKISAFIDLQYYDKGTYNLEVQVTTQDSNIQIIEKKPATVPVILSPIVSITKDISLETSGNLGKGYIAKEPKLSESQATIEGAKQALDKVNKIVASIKYNGEMSEIKKNIELEARDKDNKKIPNLKITPKSIEIIIPVEKETGLKTVSIKANITGQPKSGYAIEKISLDPTVITIKGKSEIINNINNLETEAIEVSTLTEEINDINTKLNLPKDVEIEGDNSVKVTITLSQTSQTIQAPIKFKNLKDSLKVSNISPNKISLTIQGNSDIISDNNLYFEFDLTGKSEGIYDLTVNSNDLVLPSGVKLVNIETKSIQVSIDKKQ